VRVLVLVKAMEDGEAGTLPSSAMMELWDTSMRNSWQQESCCPLTGSSLPHPESELRSTVWIELFQTGPFGHTRELVAGYWLWEVRDMDVAVQWVKRCPNAMPGPSEIEIRPFYEMSDLL
jgi:hypothetical protein